MNELEENVHPKVRRLEDDIDKLAKRYAVSVVKYSFLSLLFGMTLGAFGMVYFETPKPVTNAQRVKELRFSLQKLERLKDVHDATLKEAATNQGDIRQMVKALEVEK
jgi:hypothetical protein